MKKQKLSRVIRKKLFNVESLEARILLSSDPIVGDVAYDVLNAPQANVLGALEVSASVSTETVKQNTQENVVLQQDTAVFSPNLQTVNPFALNSTIALNDSADFAQFQTDAGQIVIGNENSNAIIQLGDATTNDGKLAFNQNLLISNPQAGGEIFVDDDLVGGANADLTVNGSGHTTILSANISTTNTNITINDSIKVSGDRTIASGASIQLGSASNHYLDANSSTGNTLTLTTATTGNVVVKGVVGGDSTNKLKSLTIGSVAQPTTNVSFDSEVTIDGNVTIYASGTVTFKSALTITGSGNLTIRGADLIVFENNVVVAGDVFLEGNEITLNGGQESLRTTGTGKTLTMRPTNVNDDIALGSPPSENTQSTLNLSSNELFTLRAGFSKIVIGHENAGHAATTVTAGTIYIGSKAANQNTFFDPVEIYGNKIQVQDFFNPEFRFYTKDTLKLDARADIEIYNEVKAADGTNNKNVTLYSATGKISQIANDSDALSRESIIGATLNVEAATEINLGFANFATVNATNNTATGNITINSTAPTTVITTFSTITPRTTGNITLSSDVNSLIIGVPLTASSSGNISVKAGILTVANTAASSTNGALTISQAVSSASGTITLEAYSDLTLNNTVSTAGSGAVSFKSTAGKILQNFDITSSTGSAITLTAGDNIEIADGKKIETTGTIAITAGKDAKISILNSTTTVNVTATNGAIIDNLTAETANILGTTTSATLTAKTGIGAAGVADINTTIASLTATNGETGGIFINENDALSIVGNGVKQDGGTGSIVITNATDATMIIDGDVNNTGSGHILIQAQDQLLINKVVKSAAGNISLLSDTNLISLGANGSIETTGTTSTIDIEAAFAITMTSGSTLKGGGGNVRLNAKSDDLRISSIDAKTGKVSLLTTYMFRVLDNDSSDDMDVIAGSLRISTQSVGQDSSNTINALEIDVNELSVASVNNQFINEANGVTVKTIEAITVKRVGVNGSTLTDQTDAAQSDLITTSNGSIVLIASAGDVIIQDGNANNKGVEANSSGNILINAVAGNLRLETPVLTMSGNINLLSGATLTQIAEGDVIARSGTIDVNATTAIVMADGAVTQTTNRDIRYKTTTGDITLGYLSTYDEITVGGNVAVIAGGKILDVDTTSVDIRAKALYLNAGTSGGVGTTENALDTLVETLAIKAGSGGVFINEANSLSVDTVSVSVLRLSSDGSTTTTQTEGSSDVVTTGSGAIVLNALDLILKDGNTDGKAVNAQGAGNVLLNATAGNITFYSSLISDMGNLSIIASGDILLNSATQIVTGINAAGTAIVATAGATIDMQAGNAITMADGSRVQTGNGNLRLNALNSAITLGSLSAGLGNISLLSGGRILDSNFGTLDIQSNGLRIRAATNVGVSANPLEINTTTLSVSVGGNEGIFLTEADSVTVGKIEDLSINRVALTAVATPVTDLAQSDISSSADGAIVLTTPAGSISVIDGDENAVGIVSKGAGNILLKSSEMINLEANVLGNKTNISLLAVGRIVQSQEADVITGSGTIDYEAGTTIQMTDGAKIETANQNIRLSAAQNVTFSGVNAGQGSVSILGETLLDAGDTELDVIAKNLRLNTKVGAGTTTNALEMNVENLTAKATIGGLFLTEKDNVSVTELPNLVINRVDLAGSFRNGLSDPAQSNLITTTGAIVLTSQTGDISILEGNLDGKGLTSAGNVLLNAAQNINTEAEIAVEGDLTLFAGKDILQGKIGHLNVSQTIYAQSGGAITMSDGAKSKTAGQDIFYQAAGDIVLSELDAGIASIAVISGGVITDASASSLVTNFNSQGLILTATKGIAGVENPLEMKIQTLTAKTNEGGIFLSEADTVVIDSASVTVQKVDFAGSSVKQDTITQSNIVAATDKLLGGIVSIRAGKSILDTGGDKVSITAHGLSLNAQNVGMSSNVLNTSVNNLSGLMSQGNLFLDNAQALTISQVASLDGLENQNGAIVLSAKGDLTVQRGNLKSAGNILLSADDSIILNSEVSAKEGNISILAGNLIQQNAGGNIATTGKGTVDVEGKKGIFMTANAKTSTQNQAIRYLSEGDVALTSLDAGSANIAVAAQKSILQSDFVNAAGLNLSAKDGIGSGEKSLKTNVQALTASVGKNGMFISQTKDVAINEVSVTVQRVIKSSNDLAQKTITNTGLKTSSNGSIVLTSENLTVDSQIAVNGSGLLRLEALKNLRINAPLKLTSGASSFVAGEEISQTTAGTISSRGSLDFDAQIITLGNSPIRSSNADIHLLATKELSLTNLNAGRGDVIISAKKITDGGNRTTDVIANNLRLIGNAMTETNALEIDAKNLSAKISNGDLFIFDANDLTLSAMPAASVSRVNSSGALTKLDYEALDGIAMEKGNLSIATKRVLTLADAIKIVSAGTIDLFAGNDLNMKGNASVVTQGEILHLEGRVLTVSEVQVPKGAVSLVATRIAKNAKVDSIISADKLRLQARSNAGMATNPLAINVNFLSAKVGNGGLFLSEHDTVTVSKIDALSVTRASNAEKLERVTDIAQADLNISGATVLVAQNDIVLTNGNSDKRAIVQTRGNLLLDSKTGKISTQATIRTSGSVSLHAENLEFSDAGQITLTGSGTIEMQASENLTMAQNTIFTTKSGNMRLNAEKTLTLGNLTANLGNVSLLANIIVDGNENAENLNVKNTRIQAQQFGSANNTLELNTGILSATIGDGGFFANVTKRITLGETSAQSVNQVLENGLTQKITDTAQSGLISTDNGKIFLSALDNVSVYSAVTSKRGDIFIESKKGSILQEAAISSTGKIQLLVAGKVFTNRTQLAQIVDSFAPIASYNAVNSEPFYMWQEKITL